MNVEQMIKYLRLSVSIQDPTGTTEQDSVYLSMTDEDILLLLDVVMTRDFSDYPSLDYLPTEDIYAVIILAKKELYYSLAVKEAPLYDLGADNNNYLKQSQRFDHYIRLIEQADKEYQDYLENGGAGGNTLTSFDVLLPNRYATKRNYELGSIPTPLIFIDSVTENSVEVRWKVKNLGRFFKYKVYLSTEPILDMYAFPNHIKSNADLISEIKNIHQTQCRIEGLEKGTSYYIAISVTNMTGLTGYAESTFETLEPDQGE